MKDFITNMFNLEPRIIHDIEIISSDNAVFAVISLRKAKVHLLKHTATVKEVLPTLSLMVLIPLSFTIREDISALSAVKCSLKKIPLQCPAEEFQSIPYCVL